MEVIFVAKEMIPVVLVQMMGVLLKYQCVLSIDTASVPLTNQEVLSVDMALAE